MKTIAVLLAFMPLLAADTEAATQERLEACRQQIDSLDQRLVELIQERARMVQEVGAIKREAHLFWEASSGDALLARLLRLCRARHAGNRARYSLR
jgi:chorismate mutase